jgi:hypothetical protein
MSCYVIKLKDGGTGTVVQELSTVSWENAVLIAETLERKDCKTFCPFKE